MTQCGSRLFCLQWRLHWCQWVNSTCIKCSHLLNSFELLRNRKKNDTYLYGYCVYNQLQNENHRCQFKQMHGNYFRITTALCHLTAVYCSAVRSNRGITAIRTTDEPLQQVSALYRQGELSAGILTHHLIWHCYQTTADAQCQYRPPMNSQPV